MTYDTLLVERKTPIAIITLNRPKALNALSATMKLEMQALIQELDSDEATGAIIITGNDKAFAAGADITEMVEQDHVPALNTEFLGEWDSLAHCQTPTIAAVAGFALGGGCELAMMCDLLFAADNARFGQPEIKIGTLPGLGGTQRLTRLVGKAKAMDLCLTGRMMDAEEAERAGLVSRVVPLAELLPAAIDAATSIAGFSRPALKLARECVDAALNTTLDQGLRTERRAFHSLFGTPDQREGMRAFVEKREPKFQR